MVNAPSLFALSACLLSTTLTIAQTSDALSAQAKKYVSVSSPKIVLTHERVIDGTGAAPVDDQNITIEGGKVTAISPGQDLPGNDGVTILNLNGHSVMPGIVGMHDHLCSVTYVDTGLDRFVNLEHGFSANTASDHDKKPDTCSTSGGDYTLEHMTPDSSGKAPDLFAGQPSCCRHLYAAKSRCGP